ncbi:MAG: CHASE domain-containing protein [Sandaracinaceae bacterium]
MAEGETVPEKDPSLAYLEEAARRSDRWKRAGLLVAVGAVGLAITGVLAIAAANGERRRANRLLRQRARVAQEALAEELREPRSVLFNIAGLHYATGNEHDPAVRAEQFGRFVEGPLRRYDALEALQWVHRVHADQRADVETAVRERLGVEGFAIREERGGSLQPAGPRDEYFPIVLSEGRAESGLGFDLGSEPTRWQLLQRAQATGRAVASGVFRFVEDPDGAPMVALYQPVYGEGEAWGRSPETSVDQRRKGLRGYAVAVFEVPRLMEDAITGAGLGGLALAVCDVTHPEIRAPVHVSGPRAEPLCEARPRRCGGGRSRAEAPANGRGLWAPLTAFARPLKPACEELDFADRRWSVVVAPGGGALIDRSGSWWVLIAGTVLTGLVVLGLMLLIRARDAETRAQRAFELGSYRLERKLGEGGMGMVYLATHAMLRRRTAVKLVQSPSEHALTLFEREVRAASRLTHPHTIQIFDYGRTASGVFYYAMEYIDGLTLHALLHEERKVGPGRVAHLMAQTCEALVEAHAKDLVHRDIKPANVMIGERGGVPDFVKVLDFGLVADLRDLLPEGDGVAGTPYYVAPEAIRKEPLTPAADVYAVGCTAYHLIAGRPPYFAEKPREIYRLHQETHAPALRLFAEVPEALEELIARCMAKSPGERPTAADCAEAFRSLVAAGGWALEDSRRWWAARRLGRRPPARRFASPIEMTVDLLGRSPLSGSKTIPDPRSQRPRG